VIAACIACGLIAAGCLTLALAGDRISYAITRARWARRCRGKPPDPDGGEPGEKLSREEAQALGNLAAGRDVRART